MFEPFGTMFKIRPFEETIHRLRRPVECVHCAAVFPLSDLLEGELDEGCCPACHTIAEDYWKHRPHQEVPDEDENDYGREIF
jgi:hypothetical protein